MLSVVVYGRNDSHGYNLHKRAALSLNAIAHLLDDPTDEIIFVDYNTPDNLPTFIEAIQDTLTVAAKQRLRILRVRSTVHDRLRGCTHLQAVESIARNIGARRSNPANRWVLSSNSDMIFVPSQAGRTLSAITAGLEDGFYCLPRFELPENLWEMLNRLDPTDAIAKAGYWGQRFHLNDIVYSDEDILYDAPGDFQLALRQDLFDIDGFDERMILGWHVDSNISRRLRLFRGEVRSAIDHLYGYHCDHTRQATLLHGHDRVEDDWRLFVKAIDTPFLPHQRDTWGLAGEDIEELSLANAQGLIYIETLSQLLQPMEGVRESQHHDLGFHDLRYSPEHVLPYLCDVLSSMPRHWNMVYAGCRSRTYELVCKAWDKLGFTGRIIRPEGFEALGNGPVLPINAAYTEATLVLVEFGYGSDDRRESEPPSQQGAWSDADVERLARTKSAFETLVQTEAERPVPPGEALRYFITINTISNLFEDSVIANLSVTYTPYSSRVRHGYLLQAQLPAPMLERRGMGRWLQARLQRQAPVSNNELGKLIHLVSTLLHHQGDLTACLGYPPALLSVPLLALLEHPDLPRLVDGTPAQIAALRDKVAAERPSRQLRAAINIPISDAAPPPARPSHLARIEDWENPAWRLWARRHFGGANAYNYFDRGIWMWERIHLLYVLNGLGMLAADKTVLVVTENPDALYGVLTQHIHRVDVINPGTPPADPAEESLWRRPISLIVLERLHITHQAIYQLSIDGEAGDVTPLYDAVIFLDDILFGRGVTVTTPLLAWAIPRLRLDGILAFSGRVLLNKTHPSHWLDAQKAVDDRPAALLATHAGLTPLNPFDPTLSTATLDRLNDTAAGWNHHGHFVVRSDDELTSVGLWFLRKTRSATAAEWQSLDVELSAAYGNLVNVMQTGPEGVRTPDSVMVDAESPGGQVMFGPYLRLPAGRYRLIIAITDIRPADIPLIRPLLTVTIQADDDATPLAWCDITPADLDDRDEASVCFTVPEVLGTIGGRRALIEFPITHFGRAGFRVTAIRLAPDAARETDTLPPQPRHPVSLRPLIRMVPANFATLSDGAIIAGSEAATADLLYGPNLRLPTGRYRLTIIATATEVPHPGQAALTVTVIGGKATILWCDIRAGEIADGQASVDFDVTPAQSLTAPDGGVPFEWRIGHLAGVALKLSDLILERLSDILPAAGDASGTQPVLRLDALSRMPAAEGVIRNASFATIPGRVNGPALFGPYLPLPAGGYRLTIAATLPADDTPQAALLELQVVAGKAAPTLWRDIIAADLVGGTVAVEFQLPAQDIPWEFQIIGHSRHPITLTAIDLVRTGDAAPATPRVQLSPLNRMPATPETRWDGGAIIADQTTIDMAAAEATPEREKAGLMLYGPYLPLPAGAYRLVIDGQAPGAGATRPALSAAITIGGALLRQHDLTAGQLTAGGVIDFIAPATADGADCPSCEFQINHLGTPLTISGLHLTSLDAASVPAGPPLALALLPRLRWTGIGRWRDGTLRIAKEDRDGLVFYGPYLSLPAGGHYRLMLAATVDGSQPGEVVLELRGVAGKASPVLWRDITTEDFAAGPLILDLTLPAQDAPWEFQLMRHGQGNVTITALDLAGPFPAAEAETTAPPMITLAPLGRMIVAENARRDGTIVATAAIADDETQRTGQVLYGPYLHLPAGNYRLVIAARTTGVPTNRPVLGVEITAGGHPLRLCDFTAAALNAHQAVLDFTVPPALAANSSDGGGAPFEFRLNHLGTPLTITGLRLDGVATDNPDPQSDAHKTVDLALLARLRRGDAGRWSLGALQVPADAPPGIILYGPYISLPAGHYRLTVTADGKPSLLSQNAPVLTLEITANQEVLTQSAPLSIPALNRAPCDLDFTITPENAGKVIEVRFIRTRKSMLTINDVRLRTIPV